MDRKGVWIVAGAILLGTLLLSLSQAVAQRNFRIPTRGSSPSCGVWGWPTKPASVCRRDVASGL